MIEMDVVNFLKAIYVGDRALKSFLIDGWNSRAKAEITCISRVLSGEWNYYDKEDLVDGYLVFDGVTSVVFEPSGFMPNDLINEIYAEPLERGMSGYLIIINVGSVNSSGDCTEVEIKIHANSVSLESRL